jgi:predicted phage baseplate assembly protein
VDGVLWEEAPTLYGRGPDERVYTLGDDGAGGTVVQFGDGVTGARLSSGVQNVRFKYRKGSGLAGMVDAGQLSQLLTRPLGVRGVTNPLAPEGADDAEVLADARTNAPLTVLTLDRVVSLQDYEDYTRAYPGVGKALATWTWDGHRRGVLVTVADSQGDEIDESGDLAKDLVAALQAAGDPFVPIRVKSYRAAQFEVSATLLVDLDYVADDVLAEARERLLEAFSFEARAFGQPVALSEVVAVLQRMAGVVAVDVDHMQRTDASQAPDPAPRLLAELSTGGSADTEAQAAELLTIDPDSLADVTVST